MPDCRFERLRLELLGGGIAPTYIARTIRELEEHYADLEEAALASGLSAEEAAQWAGRALGTQADIAAAVLSRPELMAWTQRWPRATLCLRSVAIVGLLPLVPLALCFDRGDVIARWGASVTLALVITGALLLSLQWVITLAPASGL